MIWLKNCSIGVTQRSLAHVILNIVESGVKPKYTKKKLKI
jgi:hypothetical protein